MQTLRSVRWKTIHSIMMFVWVFTGAELRGEKAPASVAEPKSLAALGSPDTEDEFPAIGCDSEGNVWVCWVAYDGTSDAVVVAKLNGAKASSPVTLSKKAGDFWRPAMCRDASGRLWVTWAQNEDGNWDLWARFLAAGEWSDPIRLTRAEGNDLSQDLAVDSGGKVWMAWQSAVDGNHEILLATVTPEGLGEPLNVSRHPAGDWDPAIAVKRDGRVVVAWDSYRSGSYDVLISELHDGTVSEAMGVATSPDYEAHAALAVDGKDRVWIAWDNGGLNWGKDNKGGRKLHSQRSVEIRCLAAGQFFEPTQSLSEVLAGPLARFCELPELTVDGDGRLWLFVRHLRDLTSKPTERRPRPQARGIWNPYALCYAGGKWSEPLPLPGSNGRNDMRLAACLDSDGGVWAAWADDARRPKRAEEPGNHNVHAARLKPPSQLSNGLPVDPLDRRLTAAPQASEASNRPERHTLTANGKTYLLLYGDTHRHTDISRCAMNYDGSLIDTYRYAIDVARLDFLAISDHDQDLLKHRYGRPQSPLQSYAWWRSEKYCDLFYIEGEFLSMYGYEHGGSFARRGGHKNVVYLRRGRPCYEEDAPAELFAALKGTEAVAIPHQLADGPSATDWGKWNPQFERVAEIYQTRGSYEYSGASPTVRRTREGYYFWDALAKGIRIGVIASSDHGQVSGAYAGVYSSDMSRRGVIEGLKSRRTFGATRRLVIEFRLGNRLLGEEVEVDAAPSFQIFAKGNAPLTKVQVVKNNRFVYTAEPAATEYRCSYSDQNLEPGKEAYYYLRCEQENGGYAWSSPIWVRRAN